MNQLVFNVFTNTDNIEETISSIENLKIDCEIRIFDGRLIKNKKFTSHTIIDVPYEDITVNKENLLLSNSQDGEILVFIWNRVNINKDFNDIDFEIFKNEDIGCIYGNFKTIIDEGVIPTHVKSMPVDSNISLPLVIFPRNKLVKAKTIEQLLSTYISVHIPKYLCSINFHE